MTYEISKEFHFSASHQLDMLPEGHQCARLHGHNYIVKVTLGSEELNDVGFVMDYGDLKFVSTFIDSYLDHRHLNDVFGDTNPTAENMCVWFWDMIVEQLHHGDHSNNVEFVAVHISETPKTWAVYYRRIHDENTS